MGDNAWAGESSRIPVVASYRYLGVEFNNQLDVAAMAEARAAAARKVYGIWHHALCDRRLPVHERVTIAKAYVMPVALYGAELWAGNVAVVHKLEMLLNDVWCTVLNVPRHASLYCVRRSAHCLSARNASLVASARAFAKWRSSRTWIGELLRGADFNVLTVWSRRVASALSRVDKTRAAITAARDGDVAAAKRTTAAAAVRAEAKSDTADAGRRWRRYQLDDTVTEARKLAVSGVRDLSAWMVVQVTRMRVGVFNTYQRLAQCTAADAKWATQCPFCNAQVPEDLAHFLLECPTWAQQRALYLHPILRRCKVFSWLGKQERRADLTHILLGGAVGPHRALSLARKEKADKKKANRGAHHDAAVAAPAAAAPAPAPAAAAAPAPAVLVAAAGAAPAANLHPVPVPVPAPHVPVPVPRDVLQLGRVAPPRLQNPAVSGLNWMVGVGRFVRAVWSDRTAHGPPLSLGRHRGMAELGAPGGGGGG